MVSLPNSGMKANFTSSKIDVEEVVELEPGTIIDVQQEGIVVRKLTEKEMKSNT